MNGTTGDDDIRKKGGAGKGIPGGTCMVCGGSTVGQVTYLAVTFLFGIIASKIEEAAKAAKAAKEVVVLFHYTDEVGHAGILQSQRLNPSLKHLNPADVRYGNGQYLSDIVPGTKTRAQLSREFLGMPFQGSRFTHYIQIDVTGLNVVKGRAGVFVVPNEVALDLVGRIVGSGVVP